MVNTLASTSQTEGKVENQIVDLNPISVLLQKSQKAPGQVLQIPTDLRTSLLTSNESLKQNVSLLNSGFTNVKHENSAIREDLQTLRNENNFLRQDIQSLQSYSDVQFRGFPRLPIEIQQIIWQYYLVLPQVIALDVTYTKGRPPWPVLILYGPSCPLLQVCKDSRTEARKKYPQQIQGQSYLDMLPNRLDLHNQASDTLWRVGKDIRPHSNFIYETLEAICDEIDILAIPYQQWYYSLADQENSIENLIDSFCLSEVQELILVMGDPSLSTRQDLTFVAPKLLPETVISLSSDLVQQFDTLDSKFLVCLAENNWDLLAKHSTDMLQAVANNYQQLRKEALACEYISIFEKVKLTSLQLEFRNTI